jgi:cell division protein FtsB
MVSPTTDDYIYIGLGIAFGAMFALNYKAKQDDVIKTDDELRKDLEYYKNLSESLTQDKNELKEQIKQLKGNTK